MKRSIGGLLIAIMAFTVIALNSDVVRATSISLGAAKDNTLFENADGNLSSGAGPHVYSGLTGHQDDFNIRRSLLAFDIVGSIPAGSTINSAELTLEMTKKQAAAGPMLTGLHCLTSDWGEGASVSPAGAGATALAGDATWLHTFSAGSLWGTAGGDFAVAASATLSVDALGSYTWGSTAAFVADVQDMLDNPGTDFGWVLRGDEATEHSARQFGSRENGTEANRPVLLIDYTEVPEPSTLALLLGAGLVGLVSRRNQLKRNKK
jgi:hypothetical protein